MEVLERAIQDEVRVANAKVSKMDATLATASTVAGIIVARF